MTSKFLSLEVIVIECRFVPTLWTCIISTAFQPLLNHVKCLHRSSVVLVVIELNSLFHTFPDKFINWGPLEVYHYSKTNFNEENDEKEGKECAQHPSRLFPSSTTAEEAHDADQGAHPQQDVGGEVVVRLLVRAGLQVQVAVEQEPQTDAKNSKSTSQSKKLTVNTRNFKKEKHPP